MRFAIRHARLLTAEGTPSDPLGLRDDATVVIDGDRVVAVLAPGQPGAPPPSAADVDAAGRLVSPGLVDCHTHPIFAGDRSGEFGLRARGASYLEIAAAGGGIAATTA